MDVENPGITDHFNVGLGNMSGINGNIDVFGAGATYLNVDDSSDAAARIVTMKDDSIYALNVTRLTTPLRSRLCILSMHGTKVASPPIRTTRIAGAAAPVLGGKP